MLWLIGLSVIMIDVFFRLSVPIDTVLDIHGIPNHKHHDAIHNDEFNKITILDYSGSIVLDSKLLNGKPNASTVEDVIALLRSMPGGAKVKFLLTTKAGSGSGNGDENDRRELTARKDEEKSKKQKNIQPSGEIEAQSPTDGNDSRVVKFDVTPPPRQQKDKVRDKDGGDQAAVPPQKIKPGHSPLRQSHPVATKKGKPIEADKSAAEGMFHGEEEPPRGAETSADNDDESKDRSAKAANAIPSDYHDDNKLKVQKSQPANEGSNHGDLKSKEYSGED